MSKSLLILLALGGGLAGGTAGHFLFTPPAPAGPAEAGLPELGEAAAVSADEQRLRSLEAELASMRVLMNTMERRLTERTEVRPAAQDSPLAAAGPSAAPAPDPAAIDTTLDARIEQVIENIEEREARERRERQAQRREEFLTARVARYAEELGLDDYQAAELKRVLSSADAKRFTLFDEMREGGNWNRDQIREASTEIQQNARTELELVLTPSQLVKYDEMQSQDRGGWFGGGGGRGGGGRPGGGGGGNRGGGF